MQANSHMERNGAASPIPLVVRQHVEESASIRNLRSSLLYAPQVKLRDLGRFDERLSAHLDGMRIAGEACWPYCEESLERPAAGEVFSATLIALENRETQRLDRLTALALSVPSAWRGFLSAFGWAEPRNLQGMVKNFLASDEQHNRLLGISICGMHRVDPGPLAAVLIKDADPRVRARALRTVGEIGKIEHLRACISAMADDEPSCRLWAAWSSLLLGDRGSSMQFLSEAATKTQLRKDCAFQAILQALPTTEGHSLLQSIRQHSRKLIFGAGLVGDIVYIPWLIGLMSDDTLCRIAGESFSLITGADLSRLSLRRSPPQQVSGPTDDPDDTNVEMEEDEGLPWPDAGLVAGWWDANAPAFTTGTRYFMGEPLNRTKSLHVLKDGFQRQRLIAAHHSCLMQPGTSLFECRAPAWRQQQILAAMV